MNFSGKDGGPVLIIFYQSPREKMFAGLSFKGIAFKGDWKTVLCRRENLGGGVVAAAAAGRRFSGNLSVSFDEILSTDNGSFPSSSRWS